MGEYTVFMLSVCSFVTLWFQLISLLLLELFPSVVLEMKFWFLLLNLLNNFRNISYLLKG